MERRTADWVNILHKFSPRPVNNEIFFSYSSSANSNAFSLSSLFSFCQTNEKEPSHARRISLRHHLGKWEKGENERFKICRKKKKQNGRSSTGWRPICQMVWMARGMKELYWLTNYSRRIRRVRNFELIFFSIFSGIGSPLAEVTFYFLW